MKLILSLILLFSALASSLNCSIPLFRTYPNLTLQTDDKACIHHVNLGTLPTPLQQLKTLGNALNHTNLWIKRDDKTGTLFGGNKVRKLEFLLGDALGNNAKGVLTVGYAGSNHTTATAVYAQQKNLECFCLHLPQIPTKYLQRNIKISQKNNAHLAYFSHIGERDMAKMEINKAFKERTGMPLYFIPSGGSNEIGAIGFVNAALELKEQIDQKLMPEPDYIYVACGSCATTAGLMLGLKIAGLKTRVIPVSVSPASIPGSYEDTVLNLYRLTSLYLHKRDETFPILELTQEESNIVRHDFEGERYAEITQDVYDAVAILNASENIKLDGTYTGKAFACLMSDILNGALKDKVVLFWDTFFSGECTDQIASVDYKDLPEKYQAYFQVAMQQFDQGV